MIYVTHDQVEAMTMGDRICVMKDGNIMQVAEPLALYNQPANLFVAGFIGSPSMNFFNGTVRRAGNSLNFVEDNPAGPPLTLPLGDQAKAYFDRPLILGLRPEDISDASADSTTTAEAMVEITEPMGAETFVHLNTGVTSFIARVRPTAHFTTGQKAKVAFRTEKIHLFDPATGQAIR
jgi:multiple sugar transport system ATP-binding protein